VAISSSPNAALIAAVAVDAGQGLIAFAMGLT
jgi:hypothetical protein